MRKLLGGILVAAGVLIAGLSGICSALFLLDLTATNFTIRGLVDILSAFVPSLLIGVGLVILGRRVARGPGGRI
ncbi:hypothetical protein [Sphingomonas jaspsi]|uniref:hypothetical protein n=1 Tax=Sphingomonas jaspsi TaxID=392409 RepID=UPI00055F6074|nr:hypothetical protein [Sphingomonas jaspsi]